MAPFAMIKSWLRTFDRRVTKGRLFLLRHGVLGKRYRMIQRLSQNPILIGGCGRSGTSLLLSLLSAHSSIYAVPYETAVFCPWECTDGNRITEFHIDRLYSFFLSEYSSLEGCKRWCEKTPKNIRCAARILDYFGSGARFVHIVRDGRDVVTSRHPSDPSQYWVPPERWVNDVRAGRAVENHPQVITTRYEDLTADPLPELRRLCDFLDEPFETKRFRAYPESAQFGTADYFQADTGSDLENEKVHARSVKRWKKEKHDSVINELFGISGAKELLEHYRYL